MRLRLVLAILLFCGAPLGAESLLHQFGLWELGKQDKILLYWGWTNGFFQGRGARGLAFANCLSEIKSDQAIAMIDKQYRDHPEKWSRPFGEQVIEALTVAGGPCEGMNPFPPDSK